MDLYYILLIIYFLIFLGLCIKNLKWAIYLIVFSLPSYLIRFSIGWLPMTLLEGMVVILFLVWLFKLIKGDVSFEILKNKSLVLLIGLFLVSASVSVFVSPELRVAAGIWRAYFIEPILFLAVLISVIKRKDLKYIFYTFGLSVFILSLVAIYQKITGSLIANPFWAAEATRRVTGVFEYPNALALLLGPIVILLLGWLAERRGWYIKGWLSLVVIAGVLAVYFTGSKGAILGMLVAIVFYSIFYIGKRKYFIGLLVLALLAGGYLISTERFNMRGIGTVEGGDSVTTRLEVWGETLEMLKARLILGAGLAGYQEALEDYHQKEFIEIYLYPHNIFFNFWSEIGILGLIVFLGVLVWFYRSGFRKRNELSVILMAAMVALLVHGLVDVPYFKNDLSILFWILIGGMIILDKDEVEKIAENEV